MAEELSKDTFRKYFQQTFQAAQSSPGTALFLSILLVFLDVVYFRFNGFLVSQIPKVFSSLGLLFLNSFITVFAVILALWFVFKRLSFGTQHKGLVIFTVANISLIFLFGGFYSPGALIHLIFPFLFLFFMKGQNMEFEEYLQTANILWIVDFYGYSLLSLFFAWAVGLRIAFSIYVLLAAAAGLKQAQGLLSYLVYMILILFYIFMVIGNLRPNVNAVNLVDILSSDEILGARALFATGIAGMKSMWDSMTSPLGELDCVLNPEKKECQEDIPDPTVVDSQYVTMKYANEFSAVQIIKIEEGEDLTFDVEIRTNTDNPHTVELSCRAIPEYDVMQPVTGSLDVPSPYSLHKGEDELVFYCTFSGLTAGGFTRNKYDIEIEGKFLDENQAAYYDIALVKEYVYDAKKNMLISNTPHASGGNVKLSLVTDGESNWIIKEDDTSRKTLKIQVRNMGDGKILDVNTLEIGIPEEITVASCNPRMTAGRNDRGLVYYSADSASLATLDDIGKGDVKTFTCRLEYNTNSFNSDITSRTLRAQIEYNYQIMLKKEITVEAPDEDNP